MSNLVSALNGASFEGFALVKEIGLQGMITLRGNLSDSKIADAVAAVTGGTLPGQREIIRQGDTAVAWMSPDELLLLCRYDAVAKIIATLQIALAGSHFMVANVSDARALFRVSGPATGSGTGTGTEARHVLAKLAPVDFSPDVFTPGILRRSRLAQVPAAMWISGADSIDVICFRSVAPYVMGLLSTSAARGGEVGLFA